MKSAYPTGNALCEPWWIQWGGFFHPGAGCWPGSWYCHAWTSTAASGSPWPHPWCLACCHLWPSPNHWTSWSWKIARNRCWDSPQNLPCSWLQLQLQQDLLDQWCSPLIWIFLRPKLQIKCHCHCTLYWILNEVLPSSFPDSSALVSFSDWRLELIRAIVEDSGAMPLCSSHSNSFLVNFSEMPANLNSSPLDVLTVISSCCLPMALLIFSKRYCLSKCLAFSCSSCCFSLWSFWSSFSSQAIPISWLDLLL